MRRENRKISNDIFVNAEMIPFDKVLDQSFNLQIREGYENVIISNGKLVNVVSDSYGFISNQTFFKGFEDILNAEHIKYKVDYKNINDCQFVADYYLEGEQVVGETAKQRYKDSISPKIRIQNSYDGKMMLSGYFGFFRKVCENGLHVMKHELAFKVRRTINSVEIVFPSMAQMLNDYKSNEMIKIHRSFEVLAETPITDVMEVVKSISTELNIFRFDKSDKSPNVPSKNAQIVLDTISNECNLLDIKPNAWIVYNAFNEWLYNDNANSKTEELRRNLDIKLFSHISSEFATN